MGGAGILVDEKEPLKLAALINRAIEDKTLKKAILKSQKKRLEKIRNFDYPAAPEKIAGAVS